MAASLSAQCGQEKTQHLPAFGKRCGQTGKPAVSWHSNGSTAYFNRKFSGSFQSKQPICDIQFAVGANESKCEL